MKWKYLYPDQDPSQRANALLFNVRDNPTHPVARLLSYPWDWYRSNLHSQLEICFFSGRIIGNLEDYIPTYYRAFLEPTFPRSVISTDIADKIFPNWDLVPRISSERDIFAHSVELIGQVRSLPEFRGENSETILVSPSISYTIGFQNWYIISEDIPQDMKPFVLIGSDILHQIVTIFSNEWIMVGADDETPVNEE